MKALGLILAGGNNHRMQELSSKRAIAAMPIGGSYRCIDFALSNMTNSKIQRLLRAAYAMPNSVSSCKFLYWALSEPPSEIA